MKRLHDLKDVQEMIRRGAPLAIAGDESLLRQLPKGNWIGGSIPYFVADEGGVCTREKLYVTELPAGVTQVSIKTYDPTTVERVYAEAPENGFSLIVIPASSPTHLAFALRAPSFDRFAQSPLIGWISGVLVSDLGKVTPKVFAGTEARPLEDGAVVMHVQLPKDKVCELGIVNIFRPGEGEDIVFLEDGFSAQEAEVGGKRVNFAEYCQAKKIDTRLPLVADYYGASINVSFQKVDAAQGKVDFYAPVFRKVQYRFAKPVSDYVSEFTQQTPKGVQVAFSCNCILNYLYSEARG
ncbi:MAG: hypothetical protein QM765_35985 [Myxococcales bacterium]